jgi:cation diffusion facilitator family transporter
MLKRNELTIIRISFFLSLLICVAKFAAWFFTHSLVILSDALESVINVAGAGFAWYSIFLSGKPKDIDHPYGHGKIEFFSIGLEGAMIFIAGIVILVQSALLFVHPKEVEEVGIGLWISIAAGAANFLLGYVLIKKGKQLQSLALQGNGKHLMSDSYTSVGVILALLLILATGFKWIDPLASAIAGVIIIYTGLKLIRKAVRGLMDEVDLHLVDEIISILKKNRQPIWIDIHNLRVQRFGNSYHVDCHVTLPYYYSLIQVHDEITKMDQLLNKEFAKGSIEFFIHTDPCIEASCYHCLIHDCNVRKHAFEKKIEWSKENLLPNKKHLFSE